MKKKISSRLAIKTARKYVRPLTSVYQSYIDLGRAIVRKNRVIRKLKRKLERRTRA